MHFWDHFHRALVNIWLFGNSFSSDSVMKNYIQIGLKTGNQHESGGGVYLHDFEKDNYA